MRGQIFTPPAIVDLMVEKLFRHRWPTSDDLVLDPGCGTGAFIEGILRWCHDRDIEPPYVMGLDSDGKFIEQARRAIGSDGKVTLISADFLLGDFGIFDFIIGNPPYVRLERLSEPERALYRRKFTTAFNRFDLYILFFEKALYSLAPGGRLVFITPEKYEYTMTGRVLRQLMAEHHVEEIHHIDEGAFQTLITYPTISTINRSGAGATTIIRRDGSSITADLPGDGSPWLSTIEGWSQEAKRDFTLKDICLRISCGVATGADGIFVMPKDRVPKSLEAYAYPTVSGKQLTSRGFQVSDVILSPYDTSGGLLPEEKLRAFKRYFSRYRDKLISRHCVTRGRRRWYAFHENPPMPEILRPKILCKDIAKEPRFWADDKGEIVPRHSVYYIVPVVPTVLPRLLEYLNGKEARKWLLAHCQRAANGFIRLQSSVLKDLPIPGFDNK